MVLHLSSHLISLSLYRRRRPHARMQHMRRQLPAKKAERSILPAKKAGTMTHERLSADGVTHGVPVLYAAELV